MNIQVGVLKKLSQNIILETYTLKEALEQLDHVLVKVLFIVKNGRLKAALTDGDVRRAILNGASLKTSVMKIANYAPIYVEQDDREYLQKIFEEKKLCNSF